MSTPPEPSNLRTFLIWVADLENTERIGSWSAGDRDSLRSDFEAAYGPLPQDDWLFLQKGDFALLRNICSDKVACVLVMMTAVPEPPAK